MLSPAPVPSKAGLCSSRKLQPAAFSLKQCAQGPGALRSATQKHRSETGNLSATATAAPLAAPVHVYQFRVWLILYDTVEL